MPVQAGSAVPADDLGESKVSETTDVSVPSDIPGTSKATENCRVQSTVNPLLSPSPPPPSQISPLPLISLLFLVEES